MILIVYLKLIKSYRNDQQKKKFVKNKTQKAK